MPWRLWKEDEAILRKFLKEMLGVEPKEIVIFSDEEREKYQAEDLAGWFDENNRIFVEHAKNGHSLYLGDVMHEAVHLWKPKWSEEHVEDVAQHLAEIFRIYEKEERKIWPPEA